MHALQRHIEPGHAPVPTGALPELSRPYYYQEQETPRHIDPGPETDYQAYVHTNNVTLRDAPLAERERLFAPTQFEAIVGPDATPTSTYGSQWEWDMPIFPSHDTFQDGFVFQSRLDPVYYPAPLDFSIAHEEEARPSYAGYLQSNVEMLGTNTSMPVGSSQVSINDLPPEADVPAVYEAGLPAMSTASSEEPGPSSDPRKDKRSSGRKRLAARQYNLQPFEQVLDLGIDPLIKDDDTSQTAGETSKASVVKRTRKEKGPRKSCACDLCHALKLRCLTAPGQSTCGTCVKTNMDLPADQQVVCESTRIPRRKGRRPNSVKAAMRIIGLIA
ncbi:hypothetical protein CERSUDRAFT_126017 [Gelatoporia subvermispora B]|uniref:Uncharacterized protein n=1 Tax=Ceriporiopsis subvermispora (strain B) TaxID=914234 RepID=M2PDB8_CERS8|nr:hypothetical protein CERSUDRAFT_126017 [Gelatoporia subvermispora B]